MLTYTRLQRKPHVFRSLTGTTVEKFDQLFDELARRYAETRAAGPTRRDRKPRRRRAGGGRPYTHSLQDRLLMTVLWLRLYPTLEVLGFWFGLDKSAVSRTVNELLPLVRDATAKAISWGTEPERKARLQRFMEQYPDFPEVLLIVDATEQRIQRPQDPQQRQAHFSGKRQACTLKTQIAVAPDGGLRAVSDTVPGPVHDFNLLGQTGLLGQLAEDEAAMGDLGYQGAADVARGRGFYHPYKKPKGGRLTPEEKAYNRVLARCRVVVEHTLAQMKRFAVLDQVYRHRRDRYNTTFRAVAGIVAGQLATRPLVAC